VTTENEIDKIANDRRDNKFRFSKEISLGNVLTVVVILWGVATAAQHIVSNYNTTLRQHQLMWSHFIMHEYDLTPEEIRMLSGEGQPSLIP